jgi:hypothetical protein
MHPDERFARDSQSLAHALRKYCGHCTIDYSQSQPGRLPGVTLTFASLADANAFNRAILVAMRAADAVDALDAEQEAAGFDPADEPILSL